MRPRHFVLLALASAGVVAMVLAIQLVDQGAEPPGKQFLAKVGFTTRLWVDVPMFVAGWTSFLVAAVPALWNRRTSPLGRAGIVLGGLVTLSVGLGAWAMEDRDGSGLDFSFERASRRVWSVYEEDEQGDVVRRGHPVFEGSPREAAEYVDRRQAAGENYLMSGVIIGGGAVLILLGSFPLLSTERTDSVR
jgi:hypothetical protein